jgi:hypothetical protein
MSGDVTIYESDVDNDVFREVVYNEDGSITYGKWFSEEDCNLRCTFKFRDGEWIKEYVDWEEEAREKVEKSMEKARKRTRAQLYYKTWWLWFFL